MSVLRLDPRLVAVLDDGRLQDGPTSRWDPGVIRAAVHDWSRVACENFGGKLRVVLSFDAHGVSGHVNHIDTGEGTIEFASHVEGVEAWQVVSESLATKFSGVAGAAAARLWAAALPIREGVTHQGLVGAVRPHAVWTLHRGLVAHKSQYVWFRALYVLFSRYAFVARVVRVA